MDPNWDKKLIVEKSKDGGVVRYKPCSINYALVLSNDVYAGRFRRNDFTLEIEVRGKPWDLSEDDDVVRVFADEYTTKIRNDLSRRYGFEINEDTIYRQVVAIAADNAYDPLLDYLDTLTWDSTPRLDTWLANYCGVEQNEYTKAVGRKWMIGAVARTYRPGCKMDNVLILEGAQYLGKSAVLRTLASPAYFSDTPIDIGDKDSRVAIRRFWIVELAELESLRKAESTKAKAFFSQNEDHFRPPYGRTTQRFPRRCVFAGTSNADTYLHDSSGNRRYWPVYCTKVDLKRLERDRDQLWAEARAAFLKDEEWWLTAEETSTFATHTDARTEEDSFEEEFRTWMEKYSKGIFTREEVYAAVLNASLADITPAMDQRIGRAAKRAKFHKLRLTSGGVQRWFYSKSRSPSEDLIHAAATRREKARAYMAKDKYDRKDAATVLYAVEAT